MSSGEVESNYHEKAASRSLEWGMSPQGKSEPDLRMEAK